MKDKEGNVIVVTEDNAAEVAMKELELERLGKDPDEEVVEDLSLEEDKKKKEQEEELDKKIDKEVGEEESEEQEDQEEETKEETKEEEVKKSDEDILSAKVEDLTEEEKARYTELVEAEKKEEERILAIKDEELSKEDKEKKEIILAKLEERQRVAFDEEVKAYSEDKKISIEEAKKTLESAHKIMDKYDSDSKKIAIANLGLQQLISKKDEEIQAVKKMLNQPRRPQSADEWRLLIKKGGIVDPKTGSKVPEEKIVQLYREKNPDDSEDFTDDQIVSLIAKDMHLNSQALYEREALSIEKRANEKRSKLIDSIPEVDKQFKSQTVEILKLIDDKIVLSEDYDLTDILNMVRGSYYTPTKIAELEKEAERRGFEKGKLSVKVISVPSSKGTPPKSKGTVSWSDKQRNEAYDMFPSVTDEKELFKLWKELDDYKKELKKKQ